MDKDIALRLAGVIFSIIALLQLSRIVLKFEIIIAGWHVPIWFNVIAFLIAVTLALWMFIASKSAS